VIPAYKKSAYDSISPTKGFGIISADDVGVGATRAVRTSRVSIKSDVDGLKMASSVQPRRTRGIAITDPRSPVSTDVAWPMSRTPGRVAMYFNRAALCWDDAPF
jgi:hypothetical protein